jgi:hypothetical protein
MNAFTVIVLVVGILVSVIAVGFAQQNTLSLDPGQRSPQAKIEEVAWITGHWSGKALGGTAEEIWSRVAAHAMMGMYRLIKDKSIAFYELLTITEENGTLVLRLKHFNADLTGWEEKGEVVTFPLVKLAPNEAYFDGMTFRRLDKDKLQIFVRIRGEDGSQSEIEFLYDRAN